MRKVDRLFSPATVLVSLLLGASPGRAADAGAPAAAKVVGPPEVAWKDMSKEQKGRYMKAVVTPKMKVVFQDYDAATFKVFNCATCHGKDAKAREFKMPGPDIHPLPSTPEAFQAAMKANATWPKWVPFMKDKVMPTMATLLGQPQFNPAKPDPTAFGCKNCHTLETPKKK
jgi:mono/diheme cytochrome c family protein